MEETSFSIFASLVGLVIFMFIYFVPTIVAVIRNHPSKLGIFFANLFLGWTFLGWVLSLIWSGTNPKTS